jgi:hypothetical protein
LLRDSSDKYRLSFEVTPPLHPDRRLRRTFLAMTAAILSVTPVLEAEAVASRADSTPSYLQRYREILSIAPVAGSDIGTPRRTRDAATT